MRVHTARPLLAAVAVAYATTLVLYSVAWVAAIRPAMQAAVELGFDDSYLPAEHARLVTAVLKASPAEKAGLQPADRIVAIDAAPIADEFFMARAWMRHKPADQVQLTVLRPGASAPLSLTGTFRRRPASRRDVFGRRFDLWFPWPFLLVGLAVLFLRLDDLNAWLLALLFGGVLVSRGLPPPDVPPTWWPTAMAYQALLVGIVGPCFYWFYARFPTRTMDRRVPWLKWLAGALGLLFAFGGWHTGQVKLPPPFNRGLSDTDSVKIAVMFIVTCLTLGLVSLAENFFRARDARRKTRLLFWSTAIGLGPNLVKLTIQSFTAWQVPAWLDGALTALLCLLPIAFAYAVVVHHVLEIPVLLRLSARYLLVQRGFTILLSLGSIGLTLLFAQSLPTSTPELNQTSGIALGAVFGTALLWSGTQVHKRVSGRIDRAFFRSAYDARTILEDLAERTRTVTHRAALEQLLHHQLAEALKPRFLHVQINPDPIQPPEPPECIVPILGRDGAPLGALLLGPRLSEEPYSGEDRRLLASVASQAATALENMRLAGEIAAHLESDRRTAREMEIAREVQARLLPQTPPHLQTLDCHACCVQARAVGGDYYDFLDLGPGCAGLVLADVSGKGVHAALLVAHLEACMRSQSAKAHTDLVEMLREVNHMLFLSTAPQHYATAFFGVYSDSSRELQYVNCGHNPPIWLRHDGVVARLAPNAIVLGAFDRWQGQACRARLDPGDLLVIFSDGVTEAMRGEEEFGEHRLIEELQLHRNDSVNTIVSAILGRVQEFSNGTQYDDLTLVVARAT